MRTFSENVSERKYMASGPPSENDLVVLAYIWGTMWHFGASLLQGIHVSLSLTANARLRYVVAQIYNQYHSGYEGPLSMLLSVHEDIFLDTFQYCCSGSGAVEEMAPRFREFVRGRCSNPSGLLMDMIDRPIATAEFTNQLHAVFDDNPRFTFFEAVLALKRRLPRCSMELEVGCLVDRLIRLLQQFDYPSTALSEEGEYFDLFYCWVIDWADQSDRLPEAMQYLK